MPDPVQRGMPRGPSKSPEMPEVLYVISNLGIGGAERHLSFVGRALVGRGHGVCVYSLAGDGPLRGVLEEGGVTVFVPPGSRAGSEGSSISRAMRSALAAVHLTYVMLRTRPRIVHFFLPAAYLIGAVAAGLARVKIRVMSRRSLNVYQRGYPMMRWLEMKLHGGMTAILGNSMAVVRQLRDEEGVPEDRLGLIYNGIEIPQSAGNRIAVRSSLGLDDKTLVFVIVANLIPYKGHLDLIKAFSLAHDRIAQPWHLLVVGRDDGIEPELRAAASELNIDKHISFLGLRSDVAGLMSASDVGLLSSHQEGFSNTILEGMAAGLPMIVTNVGGNAEAVVDGDTGLVVSPHDPASFAEAIVQLAGDPALRQRYGDAGVKRIEAHFLSSTCAEKYEALYRGLMQGALPRHIPEVRYKTV